MLKEKKQIYNSKRKFNIKIVIAEKDFIFTCSWPP
jgi:hypothetical protein